MENKEIELMPYLNFEGSCEEALQFYQDIFGGNVEIVNRYDNPAMNAPENYQNKVLHANYRFGKNTLLACDVFPGSKAQLGTGDASLSISLNNVEQAKEYFDKLSGGGKVGVPFEKQFWGAYHGNLTDKYGIKWMVNA